MMLLTACAEMGPEPRPAAQTQPVDSARIAALEAQLALTRKRLKEAEARATAAEARALARPARADVPADPTVELRSEDEIKAAAVGVEGDPKSDGAQRD